MALGIPIFEAYGMTENCGYATGMITIIFHLERLVYQTKNCELKLADDGEILINTVEYSRIFQE